MYYLYDDKKQIQGIDVTNSVWTSLKYLHLGPIS